MLRLKDWYTIRLALGLASVTSCFVLQEAAGPEAKVVRVMPNTPVFVGEVASAIALGDKATKEDSNLVSELFNSVGYCAPVPENLINAVTGVSGSGPAYVFIMIEALADGGVRAGLPRDISQKLAAQTVLGSAKMVLESGKHPGQLKDMVTSPAGTVTPSLAAVSGAYMVRLCCWHHTQDSVVCLFREATFQSQWLRMQYCCNFALDICVHCTSRCLCSSSVAVMPLS